MDRCSSWLQKYFPSLGVFIFWTLWPYIVARVTRKMCLRYTGQRMTKEETVRLRKSLNQIKQE
jgi:hypothetical protein